MLDRERDQGLPKQESFGRRKDQLRYIVELRVIHQELSGLMVDSRHWQLLIPGTSHREANPHVLLRRIPLVKAREILHGEQMSQRNSESYPKMHEVTDYRYGSVTDISSGCNVRHPLDRLLPPVKAFPPP